MTGRPKLMIGAGIAIAGLGLIGTGAGATFTAQVSTGTSIGAGGIGMSLNGETGSGARLGVDGKNLGSHFAPISKDLLLKNTGTLDLASNYLKVTASGCDNSNGAPLTQALHATLNDVTNHTQVYDGTLCALAGDGLRTPTTAHADVGGPLPHPLAAGASILYRLVLQPNDTTNGLPTAAQNANTAVSLAFTGFDY